MTLDEPGGRETYPPHVAAILFPAQYGASHWPSRPSSLLRSARPFERQRGLDTNSGGQPLELEAPGAVIHLEVRVYAQAVQAHLRNGHGHVDRYCLVSDMKRAGQRQGTIDLRGQCRELESRVRVRLCVEEVLRAKVCVTLPDSSTDRRGLDTQNSARVACGVDVKFAVLTAEPTTHRNEAEQYSGCEADLAACRHHLPVSFQKRFPVRLCGLCGSHWPCLLERYADRWST